MKKLKSISLLLMLIGIISFSSCSKIEEQPIKVTSEILTNDVVFEDAIKSSLEVVVLAQQNNWQSNSSEIARLLELANNGDINAESSLEELIGMSRASYLTLMEDFATSINDLNVKYPSLQDMSQAERTALYSSAIENNESIQNYVAELKDSFRGCFIQDLCNGIVNIAALIGGPALCDVIANAVPVVGPLLCNLVLDIAKDLLFGICNALPC